MPYYHPFPFSIFPWLSLSYPKTFFVISHFNLSVFILVLYQTFLCPMAIRFPFQPFPVDPYPIPILFSSTLHIYHLSTFPYPSPYLTLCPSYSNNSLPIPLLRMDIGWERFEQERVRSVAISERKVHGSHVKIDNHTDLLQYTIYYILYTQPLVQKSSAIWRSFSYLLSLISYSLSLTVYLISYLLSLILS